MKQKVTTSCLRGIHDRLPPCIHHYQSYHHSLTSQLLFHSSCSTALQIIATDNWLNFSEISLKLIESGKTVTIWPSSSTNEKRSFTSVAVWLLVLCKTKQYFPKQNGTLQNETVLEKRNGTLRNKTVLYETKQYFAKRNGTWETKRYFAKWYFTKRNSTLRNETVLFETKRYLQNETVLAKRNGTLQNSTLRTLRNSTLRNGTLRNGTLWNGICKKVLCETVVYSR